MTRDPKRLDRLSTLSQRVLDSHAASLAKAQQRLTRLETALAALDCPAEASSLADMQQRILYDRWAAPRRAALQMAIKDATQAKAFERQKTQRAFVRVKLLQKLQSNDQTALNAAE